MANYQNSIIRHEKELNRLHDAIKESVKHRDKSPSLREIWQRAASDFHNYHSSIDDWFVDIEKRDVSDWADARDFIFQYLETDPIYFRSGYAKEMLIKKIKQCELTNKEAQILRTLIIRRIKSGALREFRKFCQLIPRIQNDGFIKEVTFLSESKDKDISTRAKFARQYLSNI